MNDPLVAPRRKRPEQTRSIGLGVATVFMFLLAFAITMVVIFGQTPVNKTHAPKTPGTLGGAYAANASTLFVDQDAVDIFYADMINITNACTPPTFPLVDPIYNVLKIGTLASTRASWAQYKTAFNGTGPGQCFFYGLVEMEEHTALLEGPADLCHAFVTAGFQYLATNNLTAAQVNNLFYNIDLAILAAFPMNMYLKNSLGLNWDVNLANQLLTTYVLPFLSGAPGSAALDIAAIAQGACNPFFATDQPTYYNPTLQAWLAYPFIGMINKLSKTHITNSLVSLYGGLITPPAIGQFKNVYVVIDPSNPNGLDPATNPVVSLFINALVGPNPAPIVLNTGPVAASVNAIIQSIYLPASTLVDPSQVPVLVIGRYVDDAQFYQSVSVQKNTLFFTLAPDDPTGYLRGTDLGILLANAISYASMSVADFGAQSSATQGNPYGALFSLTKNVSDLLNLVMGSLVDLITQASFALESTGAIVNTLVGTPDGQGYDIGGRYESAMAQLAIDQAGVSLGMKRHSTTMSLQTNVTTPYQDAVNASFSAGATPFTLPLKYSTRTACPTCLPPRPNQGACSNCWGISSTDSMSSRIRMKFGTTIPYLSRQQVTACSTAYFTNVDGCEPQLPSTGFSFMQGDATSQTCMPVDYTGTRAGGCPAQCANGAAPPSVGGIEQGSFHQLQSTNDVKTAIYTGGDIAGGITIPTDFLKQFPVYTPSPPSKIYTFNENTKFMSPGGHMIVVTGWDDTLSPPAWEVCNSWSETQGYQGCFFMQQDTQGILRNKVPWIDQYGFTATPRVTVTAPVAVVLGPATSSVATSTTAPGTVSQIYTSTASCPTITLNVNHSASAAAIQGCANSAQNFVKTTSNPVNNNLPISASSEGARPWHAGWIIMIALMMEMSDVYCIVARAWAYFTLHHRNDARA